MTDAVLGISSGVKRCVRNVQRWNCLQCVAEELPVASDGIFSELECGPVDILDVGFVTGCPRLSLPTILAAAQFDVTFGDVTQRCSSSLCPGHRTVTQSAGKLLSGSQRFNWPDWSCTAATTGLHTEIHTHTHTQRHVHVWGYFASSDKFEVKQRQEEKLRHVVDAKIQTDCCFCPRPNLFYI